MQALPDKSTSWETQYSAFGLVQTPELFHMRNGTNIKAIQLCCCANFRSDFTTKDGKMYYSNVVIACDMHPEEIPDKIVS